MLRLLYSIIITLLSPLFVLRLKIKAKKNLGYGQRIAERFGRYSSKPAPKSNGLWFHTVSLGEFNAALPLIQKCIAAFPDLTITVTATTPTGSERIQKVLGDSVFHVYLPYDLPWTVSRFLNYVKPQMVVILETEIWPNLFALCNKRSIPIFIANARLSEKSLQQYLKGKWLFAATMKDVSLVGAQTASDAMRFKQLGALDERIQILGNLKFDLNVPANLEEPAKALRALWGSERPVWVAASTHAGEEQIILTALQQINREIPNLLLLLVPRHLERTEEVFTLSHNLGFNTVLRTSGMSLSAETSVYIGNTFGEMLLFYAASDIAFVGGSLVPGIGGHNVLEPAILHKPALMGEHTFNCADICAELEAAGGLVRIHHAEDTAATVIHLLTSREQRSKLVQSADQVVAKNKGSIDKHFENILKYINKSSLSSLDGASSKVGERKDEEVV